MGLGSTLRKVPLVGGPITDLAEGVLSPGLGAKKAAAASQKAWNGLGVPDQANLSFGEQPGSEGSSLYVNELGLPILVGPGQTPPPGSKPMGGEGSSLQHMGATPAGPGDINPYEVGAPLPTTDYGTSAATGLVDPYSGVTNAFEGMTSAYKDLPPSAFEGTQSAATDMAYDPQALAGQRGAADYFAELGKTGTDPIAEADYARKKAEAEQGRKANTDAALQALEMRGQGNAGGQLTARMSGLQGTANSEYQSGLDYAAMKAGRRDAATAQGANIQHTIGTDLEKTAADKAAAIDKYDFYKLSGMADRAAKKAAGLDAFDVNAATQTNAFGMNKASGESGRQLSQAQTMDAYRQHAKDVQHGDTLTGWGRGNQVSDANTELGNQTSTFNSVTAPQTRFGNDVTKLNGVTGANAGVGQAATGAEGQLISNAKSIAGGLSGIPGGGAAPGAAPSASAPVQIPSSQFSWPTPANPNASQEKPKFF